jgi:hypothetical protein
MTAIDPRLSADMLEAARLTREARLSEATALIQRLLQGKRPRQRTGGLGGLSRDWHTLTRRSPCFQAVGRGSRNGRRERQ